MSIDTTGTRVSQNMQVPDPSWVNVGGGSPPVRNDRWFSFARLNTRGRPLTSHVGSGASLDTANQVHDQHDHKDQYEPAGHASARCLAKIDRALMITVPAAIAIDS